jgi:hypothetical protein
MKSTLILVKMRMNFIGFHNYPGELLLWHGVAEDVNPDGTVSTTYPSKWFSTAERNGWGYAPMKTSDFVAGAAQLFAEDVTQSEATGTDGRHFDRAARMLGTIAKDALMANISPQPDHAPIDPGSLPSRGVRNGRFRGLRTIPT